LHEQRARQGRGDQQPERAACQRKNERRAPPRASKGSEASSERMALQSGRAIMYASISAAASQPSHADLLPSQKTRASASARR